jgi:type VI secretion system FHA domain protein
MALTLKILSFKRDPAQETLSASFDQQGGSVGRSAENHFVLADPEKYVSRKHAVISFENGVYYLTDTSTAGTYVTNKDLHVHRNRVQLSDGDTLRIGDYDLMVSILGNDSIDSTPLAVSPQAEDPSIFNFGDDIKSDATPAVENIFEAEKGFPEADDDPFDFGPPDQDSSAHRIGGHIEGSPDSDSFVPPQVAPGEPVQTIPQDFDLDDLFGGGNQTANQADGAGQNADLFQEPVKPEADTPGSPVEQFFPDTAPKAPDAGGDPSTPPAPREASPMPPSEPARVSEQQSIPKQPQAAAPETTPVSDVAETPREHATEDHGELLNEFFKAAGIEDSAFLSAQQYPELMRTMGEVFKELIDGLMTVLRARSELKSQFRVSMTILQSVENNPLKFSPTVSEALKLLLASKQPGFVDAVEAIREGYQDVMNHQLAITAGVQASLMSLISRFDPQKFASKYEEGIVVNKKAKCWEDYRQAYRDIAREALENFFGDEFARAYEEQIRKLRTTSPKG